MTSYWQRPLLLQSNTQTLGRSLKSSVLHFQSNWYDQSRELNPNQNSYTPSYFSFQSFSSHCCAEKKYVYGKIFFCSISCQLFFPYTSKRSGNKSLSLMMKLNGKFLFNRQNTAIPFQGITTSKIFDGMFPPNETILCIFDHQEHCSPATCLFSELFSYRHKFGIACFAFSENLEKAKFSAKPFGIVKSAKSSC